MEPIFEVKYLAIKWGNSNSIKSIKESLLPIRIDIIDQNNYSLELQTYTRIENRLDGQVAFHIPDESSKIEPNFIDASGSQIPLRKIQDPNTQKSWWVENGEWNKKDKYIESMLWNHAGSAEIYFGSIKCSIDIRAISFSKDELNVYLSDFKNDFWELIYKKDSLASGNAKQKEIKLLNDETLKLITQFIGYTAKILVNPKKELKEIQTLKDSKNVRPVAKTYMEIATKGISKKLTSRDYSESYDVAENRYIYYITNKIYTMGLQISNALKHECKFMENNKAYQKKRLESFSTTKTINKRVFEHELKQLEETVSKEISNLAQALKKQDTKIYEDIQSNITNSPTAVYMHHTIVVRLKGKPKTYDYIGFNGDAMTSSGVWYQHKENDFYSFKFNKNIFSKVLRSNNTYQITGYISKNIKPWSKGDKDTPTYREGHVHERIFEFIEDIQIIDSSLEKKLIKAKNEFLQSERSNWQMPMTQQELHQQGYEKDTIDKALKDLTEKNVEINKHKEELEKKLMQIKKLTNEFKSLKIKEDSSFPNSMTFIQNQNYQGSKKMFTSFLDAIGIEEDMFKSLLLVDQIGLVNIPVLYERWCLLQIIKVLIEEYHFIPEPDWKKLLIKQILNIKHNVKINFSSDVIGRDIVLWYEKELESKKRPDFILEIKSKTTKTTRKFIMDAKFREGVDIKGLMQEMYHTKNYSENNKNMVFILHPDADNNIDNFSNPQSWADQSYYGETQLMHYDWDKGYPNHRYGAILLSPFTNNENSKGGYLDNLKRLIAMFLQYGMEDNRKLKIIDDKKTDSMIEEKSFCTLCGSANLLPSKFNSRSGMGYGYTVICRDCKHHMEYNYCSGCKNRLIKNGRYWSYHATKPIEQFNIKCPHCGDFLLEESS